ncbi:MAG TPA: glycosyltransferase family 4 protein [Candidatus Woesebacteria bacterium]|jgi:glycosyltransferase involved in cell wall biosynthesis|nr:glycosyltransferase family 4 protein [Candidatus Woesebacteria bacterium]
MLKNKLRIAFVVVRYGTQVTGGAEFLTRLVAEHLANHISVTVLTTKAIDYVTWKDEILKDNETINGVKILRFSVDYERDLTKFNTKCEEIFNSTNHTFQEEEEWMKIQGPFSSTLLDHIKNNSEEYDLFIFVPYPYATTYYGYQIVKHKAVLLPCAHDELPLYLDVFKKQFSEARGIIANTPEELELINSVFPVTKRLPSAVIGCGLENVISKSKKRLASNQKLKPYILYLGRIEAGKGCHELFEYFLNFLTNENSQIELILVGKAIMEIPSHPSIKYLGFVTPEKKYELIKNAICIINPSAYESLSLITMEAWENNKPVLVNGKCDVLRGQTFRAQGGLWYKNFEEFSEMLKWMINNPKKRGIMGNNGKKYVADNYDWPIIEKKYIEFFNSLL